MKTRFPARAALMRDDRGYATVFSASIVAAVVSLAIVVAGLVSVVAHTHRAQVAADLAAVAGATAFYAGADACGRARETAALNSATLAECVVVPGSEGAGTDVVVTTKVHSSTARARAGPL